MAVVEQRTRSGLVRMVTPQDRHTPDRCQRDHGRILDPGCARGMLPHRPPPGEDWECRCYLVDPSEAYL